MTKVQKISLADHLAQGVCLGEHQSTVRIGREYSSLHPGPAVFVTKDGEKVIPVTITAIAKKAFAEIDGTDAKAQHTTVNGLKNALKYRHYSDRNITDRTPVYVMTVEAPAVSAEINKILSFAERHLLDTSDRAALEKAKISFIPDYHLDTRSGAVTSGDHAHLRIGHLKHSACNALASLFEQAVGKAALGIESDRGKFFTLSIEGNMEKIRGQMEREYPQLAALAATPAPFTPPRQIPPPPVV